MDTGRTPVAGSRRAVGLASMTPYLRSHAGTMGVVGLLSVVGAAGTLAQPLLVRSMLEQIASSRSTWLLAALLVGLLIGVALINGLRTFLLHRTAEGMVLGIRHSLVAHLLRLPIAEYDRRRTGDLLSRVGADTTLLRAVITSGVLELVTPAVVALGATVVMIMIDPVMFAVTVAALGGLVGGLLIARQVRGASELAQSRLGEMTAAVERALTGVRTIRAARAEERETATIAASATRAYDAGVRIARLQATITPTAVAAIQGGFLAVLGIGGARVATGSLSLGDLVAFVLLLFLLMTPTGQAMTAYTQLQAGLGALQRVEEIRALPEESAGDPPPAERPATAGPRATAACRTVAGSRAAAPSGAPAPAPPAIEFDRVSFAYPDQPEVLRRISFQVPVGTRTALVGPSGAGKSTVLALLERFYEPVGGRIRINGTDLRAQTREELRAQLGYVEQEAPVLAGSIRDNLRLAAPDVTDQQLLAVLAAVNLEDLVERSVDGLDAPVGEAGVLLSGGERQRLAIARTLLAEPPILLLDEPTSNLDARNESALQHAVHAAATRRTLLIVAHRLATVVDSDQIIVLDQGQITAVGRHEELTAANPLYRELAGRQLLVS